MPKLNGCCLVIAGLLILTGCNNDKPKTKNPDRNTMPSVLKITPKRGVVPKVSTVAIAATGAQNGYLNKGDVVSVTVTFNGTVTVTGIPTLTLQVGNNDRPADYASGTGSKALVFNYTIGAEDNDTDGISIQEGELALNSGTIKSDSGVDATRTYYALAADDDYKVDTVAPTVQRFSPANGAKNVAVTENLVLTFSESVVAKSGNITLYKKSDTTKVETFDVATSTRVRIASSGKGVTIDPAADLGSEAGYYVKIDSGAFTDTAGNAYAGISDNAIWSFTSANINAPTPTISVVAITSSTGNHLLKKGDVVSVTVTFSGTVTVTGIPTLTLQVGNNDRPADYASGTGSKALVFKYIITDEDNEANGISIEANKLALPENVTIKSASGVDAKLVYGAVPTNDDYRVDTEAPTATFSPANGAKNVAVTENLELTFSENVKKGTGNITLLKESEVVDTIAVTDASKVKIEGKVVTIDPAKNLGSEASYHVQIDSGAFTDTAGNAYADISGDTAWSFTSANIDAPILTISTIDSVISSGGHSNQGTITFQFKFDKEVNGFGKEDLIPEDKFSAPTSVDGSKKSYTATLTNSTQGKITIAVKESGYTSSGGSVPGASVPSFTYTYDSVAPTLEIMSDNVDSGSTTNKKDIELKFDFSEAIEDFEAWDITVTNGKLKEDSFKGSGESYTATFTATGDGTVTIKVKANAFTDTAGNNNNRVSNTFTWTYDKTAPKAPEVTGTTPTNNQKPTWTWSGDGGNGTYRYKLDNDDFTSVATYTTFTPSVNLPEGAHTLYVQERDEAGNWSESGSSEIVIDITPPVFTSGSTATATDENSDTNKVIYTAVATDTSTVTYSFKGVDDKYSFSIGEIRGAVTLKAEGSDSKKTYHFTVVATDAAGNQAEKEVTITIYPQAEFKAIEESAGDADIKIKTFGVTWNNFSDAENYQLSKSIIANITTHDSNGAERANAGFKTINNSIPGSDEKYEEANVPLFTGDREWFYFLRCTSELCGKPLTEPQLSAGIGEENMDIGYFENNQNISLDFFGDGDGDGDGDVPSHFYFLKCAGDNNDCGAPGAPLEHTFNRGAINKRIGYFRAEAPKEKDYFGYSVSLSADGQTMAVGIPGAEGEQGEVKIYIADNSAVSGWSLQKTILADKPEGKDQFGFSVSLSADGKTLAVGAVGENRDVGKDNTVAKDNTVETQVLDDSGKTVIVLGQETYLDNISDNNYTGIRKYQGAAYLFTRAESGTWVQKYYIKPKNPDVETLTPMRFGFAVSLSGNGNTLAVGALGDNQQSIGKKEDGTQNIQPERTKMDNDAGAVYLFKQDGDTWSFNQRIKPIWTNKDSYFGSSVSLSHDGKTLAVGAPNEDGDGNVTNGTDGIFEHARHEFDEIDNSDANPKDKSGAAYLFTYSSTSTPNWTQKHYIKTQLPKANDYFASSVSLSGDGKTLAVGSGQSWGYDVTYGSSSNPVDLDFSLHNAKFVNIYRKGDDWSKLSKLESPATTTAADKMFGLSVSLNYDGKTLAVGGKDKDKDSNHEGIFSGELANSGSKTGTVYLYTDSTDSTDKFELESYIKGKIKNEGTFGPGFGFSISLAAGELEENGEKAKDTSALAVGAPHQDKGFNGINSRGQIDAKTETETGSNNTGAVYLY